MNPLLDALAPQSVAILGASDNPHKIGGRPIAFMQQYGYRGRIYPVNPGRAQVQGLPAFASFADLPEVPDLVIVAVGGAQGLALVEACAARGVAVVVVMASGYAETGTAEGRDMQARMVAACRAGGTRMIGPNCQGLANFSNGMIANFSTMFHEQPGADGALAIIGQSGATTQAIYTLAQAQGVHARYVHATGNEADVTTAELLLATVEDPQIRAVIMYAEALSDLEMWARASARAHARSIPVVVIKTGRTGNGQRAALSHTGSLPVEDRVVDAFFAERNLIRAVDPYEAVCIAALCVGASVPRGQNLVVMSNSGASCVMGADTADTLQLPLLALDGRTSAALQAVMPGFATATNPVDLTAALMSNPNLFPDVLNVLRQAQHLHLLLLALPVAGRGYDVEGYADLLAQFAREQAVTVAISAAQDAVRQAFSQRGIVSYVRERDAVHALSSYALYARRQREAAATSARG